MGSEQPIVSYNKLNLKQIQKLGETISKYLFPGAKLLLFGNLGTGKPINVTSPTFSLVKVYDTNPTIYHVDLYRLNEPQEIEYLDVFLDPKRIYIIEWADFLDYLTPEERLEIHISYNEDIKYRDVKIEGFGEKYKEMEANIEKEQ